MPRMVYKRRGFTPVSVGMIWEANRIIDEYAEQGFTLTLRQLYYQFVARALIPNTNRSYKNLGGLVNNARLAGLIDWSAIEDRTRWLRQLDSWQSPAEILADCAKWFNVNPWLEQDCWPEVWIEKDALVGVIEGICQQYNVPFFACRGYVSQSEQWRAGIRWQQMAAQGKRVIVFHLGDHDPSGIDMTRDNDERGNLFSCGSVEFQRLALNMDQVEQYGPPPNPTKLTDSRASGYLARHGSSSWELDALEPQVIADLIEQHVTALIDTDLWADTEEREASGRARILELVEEVA